MIVVAGEALMDLTPVDVGGKVSYMPHPGGSPYNVAVGLGRLGVPVTFMSRISDDQFGRQLRAHLVDSRVDVRLVARAGEPTTVAFVHLGDGEPEYVFYAEGTADRLLREEHLGGMPAGAPLHVGSIAMMHEPSASALEALVLDESRQRLVSLDPNIRPGMIDDPEAYRKRFAEWVPAVDILKLSVTDLHWLVPDTGVETAAAGWLDAGSALVLVTDGAAGARAFTRTSQQQVYSPQVEVVDTVGAGDAFTAGTLAYLHDRGWTTRRALEQCSGEDLRALLTEATMVAADTCTRSGAEPPWR